MAANREGSGVSSKFVVMFKVTFLVVEGEGDDAEMEDSTRCSSFVIVVGLVDSTSTEN